MSKLGHAMFDISRLVGVRRSFLLRNMSITLRSKRNKRLSFFSLFSFPCLSALILIMTRILVRLFISVSLARRDLQLLVTRLATYVIVLIFFYT